MNIKKVNFGAIRARFWPVVAQFDENLGPTPELTKMVDSLYGITQSYKKSQETVKQFWTYIQFSEIQPFLAKKGLKLGQFL